MDKQIITDEQVRTLVRAFRINNENVCNNENSNEIDEYARGYDEGYNDAFNDVFKVLGINL